MDALLDRAVIERCSHNRHRGRRGSLGRPGFPPGARLLDAGVATDADVKNLVYGNRVKQMPEMLQIMLKKHTEKFNKKHGIK